MKTSDKVKKNSSAFSAMFVASISFFFDLQGLWVTARKEHDLTDLDCVKGSALTRDGDSWGWDRERFFTKGENKVSKAWCHEIGSLTSLDAPELRASSDVTEPISLHQAVHGIKASNK